MKKYVCVFFLGIKNSESSNIITRFVFVIGVCETSIWVMLVVYNGQKQHRHALAWKWHNGT